MMPSIKKAVEMNNKPRGAAEQLLSDHPVTSLRVEVCSGIKVVEMKRIRLKSTDMAFSHSLLQYVSPLLDI